jgi:hypothetical protein
MKSKDIIFLATIEKRSRNYQEDYKVWEYISNEFNDEYLKQEIAEGKNGVKKIKFSYRKKIGTTKNGDPKFKTYPDIQKMLKSLSDKILRVNTIEYEIKSLNDVKIWMIKDCAKNILAMNPKLQLHFCRDPSRQSFGEIVQIALLKGDVSEWLEDVDIKGVNLDFWKINKLKVGKKIVSDSEIKNPEESEISKKQSSRSIDVEVNSEKITAYGSLKYSEPVGGLTTALQPGEEIDFIKECDKYCANPNNKDNGVIFFVQSDGTAGELAIPNLKGVVDDSERIFVGNSFEVIKWLNSKIPN